MKIVFSLLLSMGLVMGASAQTADVTMVDQDAWSRLPRLSLPDAYKTKSLPTRLDNSRNKYFPEVFMQTGYSCNQASSVQYVFTYEINAARDVASDGLNNLYHHQTIWNLLNRGKWDEGVSYFDSWNVIMANGVPSMADFMPYDNSITQWMSGYDKYYNGMKNRAHEIFAIDVGSPDGLLALKHWLKDHLNGSPVGGIANFQIGSDPMNIQQIPIEEEEGGSHIILQFSQWVGHAMTFVGWNDDVRYDFNGDGQYTNDIDINGDQVVDMRDWEIGAMLVANSWGEGWGDKGKIWVMYRLLAESVINGGIWNNSVMVMRPRATYQPLLTMKLGMRYDMRDRLKIMAGVANNVNATAPEHLIDFTCFSFQGGSLPMQGVAVPNNEFIEIGLDITPLMEFVQAGSPAKFFVEILENGSDNSGVGRIDYMSVYDHMNQGAEHEATGLPVAIRTRNTTDVGVVFTPASQPVQIVTESLTEARHNAPYLQALQVTGGTQPYTFAPPVNLFRVQKQPTLYDFGGGTKILPQGDERYKVLDLPFTFSFYGKDYQQITVWNNGGVAMGDHAVRYPYVIDPRMMVFQNVGVFPFFTNLYYVFSSNQVSYRTSPESLMVTWNATLNPDGTHRVEFAVQLFSDGSIEFHYNYNSIPESYFWISAVCGGTVNDQLVVMDNTTGMSDRTTYKITPAEWPQGLTLTDNGVLYGQVGEPGRTWILPLQVTDWNGLTARKEFVFSTQASGLDDAMSSLSALKVYPNPASERLFVEFNGNAGDGWLQVLDVGGRVVQTRRLGDQETRRLEIDVTGLERGVYFVRVGGEVARFAR